MQLLGSLATHLIIKYPAIPGVQFAVEMLTIGHSLYWDFNRDETRRINMALQVIKNIGHFSSKGVPKKENYVAKMQKTADIRFL